MDGNVNAWGLAWRLASGSVVFKVASEYLAAYTEFLKPFVHYIPIAANLSDLEEVTRYVGELRWEAQLSQIAANARVHFANHSYPRQVKRVARELVAAASIRSSLPFLSSNMKTERTSLADSVSELKHNLN